MMKKNLVFVSAQPDVPYFHWQTKVYVHNFIEKGVDPNKIHVLFVIVDNKREPSKESLELKELGVNVFHCLDTRTDKKYIPSLRPLILSEWLKENPELGECYFYHDSDIVFRELPDFDSMLNDDKCYLSDTMSYIGYNYIKECCVRYESVHKNLYEGELLNIMASIVKVPVEKIKENQNSSGGAQYLIKNTDHTFWDKVYEDCQVLYKTLFDFHRKHPINHEIQMWTSDMWAVLWNLWYLDKVTEITNKLSFSWATDTIQIYERHPILHMAGVTQDLRGTKFYKGDFINVNPLEKLGENPNYFDFIEKNSSTTKYIEIMKSLINKKPNN